MTTSKFVRGSEWRKWDLHIHTPASYHWNGGSNFSTMSPEKKKEVLGEIVTTMNSSDIAVFSTMDYWTFDGYLEIKRYLLDNPMPSLAKTIFPGMELRVEAPTDFRLNIHVILSDLLTNQQLADFKSKLTIRVINRPLSNDALIQFGRQLDPSKARAHGFTEDQLKSDEALLRLGSMTAEITKSSLEGAISLLPKGTALIIMPYDTSDGLSGLNWKAHPTDDLYFMRSAHIFETRSSENVDLFLAKKTPKNQAFFDNFLSTMGGKAKPVVSGSDAHKIADYGKYNGDRITWIKADPSFEGLKQLLNEPSDRCFIGRTPDKIQKIEQNKTRYIRSIAITKSDSNPFEEIWFNNSIDLNPELVAVIGNKGSGKSALADIIGLVTNSKQHEFFSFLTQDKFREKKNAKAGRFKATLTWESNNKIEAKLDTPYDPQSVEMVKYIPQNYLEKICNETALHSGSLFNNELKDVIFSHIDLAHRLGLRSLDELVSYKTDEVNKKIEILKIQLDDILQQIVACEGKLESSYEKTIINKISVKNSELESHNRARPVDIVKPIHSEAEGSSALETSLANEITELREQISEIDRQTQQLEIEKANVAQRSALVQKVISQLDNLQKQVDTAVEGLSIGISRLGLSLEQIVLISIQKNPLIDLNKSLNERGTVIASLLSLETEDSWISKKEKLVRLLQAKEEKLDEPNKLYRAYLEALTKWEKTKSELIGSSEIPGTISNLNKLLTDIKELPTTLSALEERRDQKVLEIYSEISGLADTYRELYAPVQSFVESNQIDDQRFQMRFDVSIACNGFKEIFFEMILRNITGSFCGISESEKLLNSIIEKYDFSSSEQVKLFTHEIIDHLRYDHRSKEKIKTNLLSQIKKSDVLGLYRSIFSLSYLGPEYALKLNGKGLSQLSPGERGTVLLIFYLMVDRDTRPIVLDQPEENLDNQTIYKVLVPCIKRAKTFRQIILVTHNPNLAVVCDAEQIVVASIDKQNKNRVTYKSGAIENTEINRSIIDILEGTRPAFDNRDSKYLPFISDESN